MRHHLVGLTVALGFLAGGAASIGAAGAVGDATTLTACSPKVSGAYLDGAPNYLRVGKPFTLEVHGLKGAFQGRLVVNAMLTVGGQAFPLVLPETLDLGQEAGVARVVIPGPTSRAPVTATLTWDQDLGTSDACHGTDQYTMPVIAATDKAGYSSLPRFTGRYRIHYAGRGAKSYQQGATWTMTPRCAIFGCSVMRSSRGARGMFRHDPLITEGTPVFEYRSTFKKGDQCQLHYADGTTRTFNFRTILVYRIRAQGRWDEGIDNVVTRFTGIGHIEEALTPSAERAGCYSETVDRVRLTGVRIGP